MDIQRFKEYIVNNNLITQILEKLGCHHIKDKGVYIQCANPDGDNTTAITEYKDNLKVVDYTRNIETTGYCSDIFSLVQFFLKCNFFIALKTVCEWIELDYYYDFDDDLPKSLKLTRLLASLNNDSSKIDNDEKPVKQISEKILSYYMPYVNDLFYKDNITYQTMRDFEIGYDGQTNRITIPIRDEIGSLIGVKGRWFGDEKEGIEKYIYLEPCSKGQVLYGLYKTYPYIEKEKLVYVVEAEKGVLQMVSYGINNVVATGGSKVTQAQINKLSRLCVDICFLFDKDIKLEKLKELADRFIDGIKIYCAIDNDNILNDKESPSDNPEKLDHLLNKNIIMLKG